MKKLILVMATSAVALSALAKTEKELMDDFARGIAANKTPWEISQEIYTANSADIAREFSSWKNKDIAKFDPEEAPLKELKMSEEDKLTSIRMRQLFTQYLIANPSEMAKMPLRAALLACPGRSFGILSAQTPNFYSELKAKDFVVDGVKLPAYARFNLAKSAGDWDTIKNAPVAEGMQAKDIYLGAVLPSLLDMEDILAAKNKCTEIENYLIKSNKFNTREMSKVQAINRALTARLVDSKIIGK